MAKIIVVTSGKGGVGKTTTSASFASGLALRGHKTAVIDFDVGLRNLDLIMGCERRVVYDLINVIHGEANLNQALIKDKQCDNLYVLAASQTRDKEALTQEGVEKVLKDLGEMGFEYIVCDSPAGIETSSGPFHKGIGDRNDTPIWPARCLSAHISLYCISRLILRSPVSQSAISFWDVPASNDRSSWVRPRNSLHSRK